jgi:hypothetical protein
MIDDVLIEDMKWPYEPSIGNRRYLYAYGNGKRKHYSATWRLLQRQGLVGFDMHIVGEVRAAQYVTLVS